MAAPSFAFTHLSPPGAPIPPETFARHEPAKAPLAATHRHRAEWPLEGPFGGEDISTMSWRL